MAHRTEGLNELAHDLSRFELLRSDLARAGLETERLRFRHQKDSGRLHLQLAEVFSPPERMVNPSCWRLHRPLAGTSQAKSLRCPENLGTDAALTEVFRFIDRSSLLVRIIRGGHWGRSDVQA